MGAGNSVESLLERNPAGGCGSARMGTATRGAWKAGVVPSRCSLSGEPSSGRFASWMGRSWRKLSAEWSSRTVGVTLVGRMAISSKLCRALGAARPSMDRSAAGISAWGRARG